MEIEDLIRQLSLLAGKRSRAPGGTKVIVVDSHCNTLYITGAKLIQCTQDGMVVQLETDK